MERIQRKLRFLWIKIALVVLSIICGVILAILIPINKSRSTFGELTPFLLSIYIICGILGLILVMFSIMGVTEYVSHFRQLRDDTYQSHRLSYEQVLDNETRKLIIECVIEKPGIHYNLLRKRCKLHPGQFQWHMDVLTSYGVIKRKKIGHNVTFYPAIGDEGSDHNFILNFPLREHIYQLIKNSPGIISSEIAREIGIPNCRSKVKYHIDRLISADLITFKQNGRRKELYPISQQL